MSNRVNRQCSELQGNEYCLVLDSQDIEATLDSVAPSMLKKRGFKRADITGAIVCIADGDYLEIWLTSWSRPYALVSQYSRVI